MGFLILEGKRTGKLISLGKPGKASHRRHSTTFRNEEFFVGVEVNINPN
jgi:hypothetical protein